MTIEAKAFEAAPRHYTIKTLADRGVVEGIINNSISFEATKLMGKRAASSSVPLFLGDLIQSVAIEVGEELSYMRQPALGITPLGITGNGRSSLIPDGNLETAFRIFSGEFTTSWHAGYALSYAAGIAYYKASEKSAEQCKEALRRADELAESSKKYVRPIILNEEEKQLYAVSRETINAYKDAEQYQEVLEKTLTHAIFFGGYTLLMEMIAKGPDGFFKQIRHYAGLAREGFPSLKDMAILRDIVDKCFNDRACYNRVFLEAQRLRVPFLSASFS